MIAVFVYSVRVFLKNRIGFVPIFLILSEK